MSGAILIVACAHFADGESEAQGKELVQCPSGV